MTRTAPTHRGQPTLRARLAVVEQMIAARPLTVEGLRAQLHAEAGLAVSVSTARTYLTDLVDEGRARVRVVRGRANRAGVALFFSDETPADAVAEAVEAIEHRETTFRSNYRGDMRRTS